METGLHAAALLATIAAGAAARRYSAALYYTATAPLSAYSWTGPIWAAISATVGHHQQQSDPPVRLCGGVEGGYNWQSGQLVLGGEADLQLSGANDTFAPWKFSNPWFGTVRGRAGYAISNFVIYGTAGFAVGELQAQSFGLASESHANVGWAAGAGIEAGFAANWSAKIEYLYVDLASNTYALTGTSNGLTASLFRMGVNYHF